VDPQVALQEKRRRRTRLIVVSALTAVTVLTAVQVFIQQLSVATPLASNILVFALVNVNLLLLVVLVLLVCRSLFKVYMERRNNLVGARFRTRLVVAFLSLSLLPALLLFLVASNLITTSVDSWFNIQVEGSLQNALEVAQTYYRITQERVLDAGQQFGQGVVEAELLGEENREALTRLAREKLVEHRLSSLQVFDRRGRELTRVAEPGGPDRSSLAAASRLVQGALQGKSQSLTQRLEAGELIAGVVPIVGRGPGGQVLGAVAVSATIPSGLADKAADIAAGIKEYRHLRMLKTPLKGAYIMLFLMVTLVILFAAIWTAVHLARGITAPIQELAEGTRAVAAGNLDYRVRVEADDDIGILVDSFNRMTEDLRRGESELTEANLGLQRTNVELEQRRAYMERVLESLAAGILSLDAAGVVNTMNPAARRILGLEPAAVLGRPYTDSFPGAEAAPIRHLIERMALEGRGSMDEQVTLPRNGQVVTLVVNIRNLTDKTGSYQGMVVVVDDITQLLRAQQAIAWGEVARRIAHEIKNPLTPIKLSTQRLRKKFTERASDYERVFDECTRTIIQEVDGLQGLVDGFSRYARMPASDPRPGDLHPVIASVVRLYSGLGRGIELETALDPHLPPIMVDPDQMKRALINLVDNAVAAVGKAGGVMLRTRSLPGEGKVEVEVADSGVGIPPDDRERLFLPYFSTKKSGTGLGLAIVYRIVTEHGGTIRVEANEPRGTRMVMAFPALPVPAPAVPPLSR
jgi:two-component system nitrogen regulation sensor histidine kinase NtrY